MLSQFKKKTNRETINSNAQLREAIIDLLDEIQGYVKSALVTDISSIAKPCEHFRRLHAAASSHMLAVLLGCRCVFNVHVSDALCPVVSWREVSVFHKQGRKLRRQVKELWIFQAFPVVRELVEPFFFFFFRKRSVWTNGKGTLTRILNLYYVMRLRLPALALTSGNRKRLTTVRHRIWFDILKGSSQTLKCCRAIKLQFFG